MNKIHFLFGVHNHQPIGNFDFVIEKAYQQSYLPFFEAMERHPSLHWNLHATGILWEWLENHHPEYIDRVAEQVRSGRLEILSGGYYEPILATLPDIDKTGQIQKMNRYVKQRFKSRPKGLWLAERVWEPHLAKVLADNGIEYTLLDDSHFLGSGMTADDMTGSFMTEEQGRTLRLLPIRQDLRYVIPFKDVGETINVLRRYATESGHRALTMFDDGEKFGLWPETHELVYTHGWLEQLLTVLESNRDWITCSRVSDYLDENVPQGRVYVPAASYYEMGEWSLPAAAQERLLQAEKSLTHHNSDTPARNVLRGGFWRNFLTKYDEANTLHKKMLRTSQKVHEAAGDEAEPGTKPSAKTQKMLDALWAGQCNCAYWHGVFGGLYLPHLRQALYHNLMAAETMADKTLGHAGVRISQEDFDKDGMDEILVESPTQNLYFAPHAGGSLFEWDLRREKINLLNVLTRRQEAYHKKLIEAGSAVFASSDRPGPDALRVKEPSLEKRLHTDWYRRAGLLDHFLHPDTRIDSFQRCQYGEQGDFINTGYRADVVSGEFPQVRLLRNGTVWSGEQKNGIGIEKTISLTSDQGWQVVYRIENRNGPACRLWFACEMAFAFSSQDCADPQDHGSTSQWLHRDHGFGIQAKVNFDMPTDVWEFPLHTVSLSEEGLEKTYQGTVVVAHMPIVLNPGQSLVRSWRVEVGSA